MSSVGKSNAVVMEHSGEPARFVDISTVAPAAESTATNSRQGREDSQSGFGAGEATVCKRQIAKISP